MKSRERFAFACLTFAIACLLCFVLGLHQEDRRRIDRLEAQMVVKQQQVVIKEFKVTVPTPDYQGLPDMGKR